MERWVTYALSGAAWVVFGFFVGALFASATEHHRNVDFIRDCFASGAKSVEAYVIKDEVQGVSCQLAPREIKP